MSKLDRGRIVDEAMALIESEGEAALAMRQLAARLEVTPMALYRYFADRDALLLALVERVSEEIEFPEPHPDPVEGAVALARCLHDFLSRHPWMVRLIANGRLASPAGLRFPEGFLACATASGLDEEGAFVFYRTMFATILGQALMTGAKQADPSGVAVDPIAAAPLPAVSELAARWRELDTAAVPERAFRLVAESLRTH